MKAGMGDPGEKVLKAVTLASKQTNLSEALILSLMYSESSFKPNAVSSKQYKGLMQIPQSVYYEDANCLIGARILTEKLKITDGDYRKAIIIYKGWPIDHPEGKRQADKVIIMAMKVRANL
jgi:soluble lytic murein transglycosylase-like protein